MSWSLEISFPRWVSLTVSVLVLIFHHPHRLSSALHEEEVFNFLITLDTTSGPDGISGKMFKATAGSTGIALIPKSSNIANNPLKYRPISQWSATLGWTGIALRWSVVGVLSWKIYSYSSCVNISWHPPTYGRWSWCLTCVFNLRKAFHSVPLLPLLQKQMGGSLSWANEILVFLWFNVRWLMLMQSCMASISVCKPL